MNMKRLLQVTSTHTATLMACLLLTPTTTVAGVTKDPTPSRSNKARSSQTPVANAQTVIAEGGKTTNIMLSGNDPNGIALSYEIVRQPSHGTLSGAAPYVQHTPQQDYTGSDSFSFRVTNSNGASSSEATVAIDVRKPGGGHGGGGTGGGGDTGGGDTDGGGDTEKNNPPVADSQSVSAEAGKSVGIRLSGSDPDGDKITFDAGSPSHGSLSGKAPNLTYTADDNFSGKDSFSFTVTDSHGASSSGKVSISVKGSGGGGGGGGEKNHPPVADSQSVSAEAGKSVGIRLSGSDPDGDDITFAIAGQPSHGSLSGKAPNVTYTPDANFSGNDSFSFKVTDEKGASSTATVSISVKGGGGGGGDKNHPPVADSQSVSTDQGTAKSIKLSGSDPDDDDITFAIVGQPSHGSLSGKAPNVTYTPEANFSGNDSFTFKVTDEKGASATATVSITVKGGGGGGDKNHPPVADSQSVSTDQGTAKSIKLSGSDPDDDDITFAIVGQPSHGSLSGKAPNVTYTPEANFSGNDSFTFKVTDEKGATSGIATVSISVKAVAVNHPPVADSQSVSTDQGTAKSIKLSGSDPDDDDITFAIVGQPSHGSLSGKAPNVTYTPEANFSGNDSFTFKVTDEKGATSGIATVSISVKAVAVNHPPVADSQSVSTDQGTAKSIKLSGSDPDDDDITFAIVGQPSHGTLSGKAPNVTYTPEANFSGNDSFTFKVTDSKGATSGTATVSITVKAAPANQPPVADSQSVTVRNDIAIAIWLSGSDPDGDNITYQIAAQPNHGSLSGTAPNVTYTPDSNYVGSDSFTFKVKDEHNVSSGTATVSITVKEGANHPPVADSQSVTTDEDTAISIWLSGSDPDNDNITFAIVRQPSNGTLSGKAPNVTYTPNDDFSGNDSFTFRVTDSKGASSTATVSITVNEVAVNHPPVVEDQSVNVKEDKDIAITLYGSDPDNDELTYKIVTKPEHGKLSGTAPDITYTPDENYNGQDSFTYRVKDSHGVSSEDDATVTINVKSVDDAPVATGQSLTTEEDTAIAISLAGTNVNEDDTLTYVIVNAPKFGTLSGSGRHWTYRPIANFSGCDAFKFKVKDSQGLESAVAKVKIKVNGKVYQAENFTDKNDCVINSDKGGFTGSGYLNMGGVGSWFEWNIVSAASAGHVTLGIRYANAGTAPRPCTVLVNGVSTGNVTFESTGSWTNWSTANITVPLNAGLNTIRILADTRATGPNVDSMMVTSNVPSSVFETENYTATNGCKNSVEWSGYTGSGFVDMGDVGSWFEWNNVSASSAGDVTLGFRYANAYGAARPCTILVNGVNKGIVSFDGTGGWDVWNTANITVPVRAGNNNIRVLAHTSETGPNVDSMTMSSVVPSNVYQAEICTAKSDSAASTDANGYIGTGFVNMGGKNSWFELNTIVVPAAGSYTLSLRYANGDDDPRPCSILVNGVNVGTVSFDATGSANTWGVASIAVPLNAGNNTIRIQANTSAGGPYVDTVNLK